MVSGSISLLCSRFFSPFPHGTGSLSVSGEYLALADGPARFTQDFTCPALLRILIGFDYGVVYGIITLYDQSFQIVPLPNQNATSQSYNPKLAETNLVWASPGSLATTSGITFVFFSYGYLDVSVPHVRLPLINGMIQSSRIGLPHSEICGSIRICQSPQLIAAYHVLHRLPEPRHPPCALMYFILFLMPVPPIFIATLTIACKHNYR